MTTMRGVVLAAVMCVGCAVDLAPVTAEAVARVWGPVYGMDAATAPVTDWVMTDCDRETLGLVTRECIAFTVFDTGHLRMPWPGSVAASSWVHAALSWRKFLLEDEFLHSPTAEEKALLEHARDAVKDL